MPKEKPSFEYVESQLRKKTFGVLGTVDSKNRPHSTGILYGVAPKEYPFTLYIGTSKKYRKTKNIQNNPGVSFVVTFPHYYLRFAPASVVQFQGKAEILPFDDPVGRAAFQTSRILRMSLDTEIDHSDLVFIKIIPDSKIFCYGVGIGLMELMRNPHESDYSVFVPEERR